MELLRGARAVRGRVWSCGGGGGAREFGAAGRRSGGRGPGGQRVGGRLSSKQKLKRNKSKVRRGQKGKGRQEKAALVGTKTET